MNEKLLNQFYSEESVREAVREFFLVQLDKLALERVYDGKDTTGIKDAKKVIENSFIELSELYGKDKRVITINEAR